MNPNENPFYGSSPSTLIKREYARGEGGGEARGEQRAKYPSWTEMGRSGKREREKEGGCKRGLIECSTVISAK